MKHLCFSVLIFLLVTYAHGKLHNPSKVRKPARDNGKVEGLKQNFGEKLHLLPSHNTKQNETVDKPAQSVQVGKYKQKGILHTTKLADAHNGKTLRNDKKSKNFRKKYSYSKYAHLNHSKHGHVSHSKHGNASHSKHGNVSHSKHGHVSHPKHGHVSHSKHAHSSHSKHGHLSHSKHGNASHSKHGHLSHSKHGNASHSKHGHVSHSKHGHVSHSKHGHMSHSKHGHVSHSKHGNVSHSKHGNVSHSKHGHVSHSKHGHVSHSKNVRMGKQKQKQLTQSQNHLPNHFGEFEKHRDNDKIISRKVQQKKSHKTHSLAKNRHLTTKSHSQRHDVILNPKRTSIADKRQQHMKPMKRTKKEKNAKKGHKRGHQNRKIHLKSNKVTPNQPKNRRVTLGKKYVNQYQTHHSVHNLPKHGQNMVKNKNNKLVKMRKNDINKPISQRKVKTRVHINVNPYTLTDGGKTQHAKGKQIKSQDVFKHTLYTDYNLLRYQFVDGDKFRSVHVKHPVSSENKNGKKYHHLHQNKKFNVRKWCTKKRKCPTAKRPVCGSDGHTYLNKCHLKEESCRNGNIKAIRLRYRGQCKVH